MKKPDIPANEAQRLAHLAALQILDTAPEDRLDNVTRLAADIFAKPVALISLVDEDRQWFKSRHGLDIQQTEREVSFCAHVVADSQPLVVEDTLADPRFQDNRLVQQDDKPIRFYAGAPISSPDGYVLGSLCVIDHQPASFSEQELAQLQRLARIVDDEIQLRHALKSMQEKERKLTAKQQLLEQRNAKLLALIERFKNTRARMISAEKLATLGLLAAGVGAEGNRTINQSRKQLMAAIEHTQENKTKGLIGQGVTYLDELRQLMDALSDTTETAHNNEWAPTDLNETVKHGRNVLVSRFGERVEVLFSPVDQLPSIPAVESQVFMALLNVLTNAAESRRGPVKIKIELVEKPDHVQIRVLDNGQGMSSEQRERACEAFVSKGKDATHFGLGLSIAQGIVRDHGGALRLQSEPNKGTKVIIALPRERGGRQQDRERKKKPLDGSALGDM